MKYTIKDVARESGVSIATVSRVLNDKDRVDANTRKKVLTIIENLGFQPDRAARTMVMKESKSIGLVVPNLTNEYWSILTDEIQKNLSEKDYALVLYTVGEDKNSLQKEISALKSLIERKVDGVIYHGVTQVDRKGNPYIMEFVDSGISIISFEQRIPGIQNVSGDHHQGAIMAVNHLVNLGHKEIAFIGSFLDIPEREMGYRNSLVMNGIAVNENLVSRISPTYENGYQATLKLLESREKFSAIFCWNDMIAFGVIRALEEKGLKVPEDIAVVGYDDIITSGLFKPALTTVRQPIQEIGKVIVDMMLEEINATKVKSVMKNVVLEMELIIRDSCGATLVR